MFKAVIFSLIAGIGGLWIATQLVPGVTFTGSLPSLLIAGLILGIIIAIVRPLLGFISFLLRILIMGILTFGAIWILRSIFPAFIIPGILPMVYSAAVVAAIAVILSLF